MNQDKFTNVYRLPGSIQIRIAKWQATFRGTSDLVLHDVLIVRNKQFQKQNFLPRGWCLTPFSEDDISITHHGKYIQTTMLTMIDKKISYKRVYLSRVPLETAEPALRQFKIEWMRKYNDIVRKYNKIKKKELMVYAWEEAETLYPSIPKESFDKALWNKLVTSQFGPAKKYSNPYFVKKADF